MPKAKTEKPEEVIAEFHESPLIYGIDSKWDRKPNPDYHPPIRLTTSGKFLDESGRVIPPSEVPASVREKAKHTNRGSTYRAPKPVEMTMAEAMNEAAETPAPKRKPGRPKKAA